MTKTTAKSKYFLIAIFCIMTFLFAFTSASSSGYFANAAVVDTTGTEVENGEVTEYSESAIVTGGSSTLKAYCIDSGMGGETRIANANVQRTITITIDNDDIITAAQNGRMKAKVLLTGSNQFDSEYGTETHKSIVYALSGGIAATNINLVENSTFTDLSISEDFLTLTPTSGELEIMLTGFAQYITETPGGGTGENIAEASLECKLTSIKILFLFDDVEVSLTINGNGKVVEKIGGNETEYTYSNPNLTYTFGEEISFEGVGITNTSYFRGWTVSGTKKNQLVVLLPKVHDVPHNASLSYEAAFANFEVATNEGLFPHTTQPLGPKVNETQMAGFLAEHVYSGENALSQIYGPSSTKPLDSGEYSYEFSVYFDVNGENGDKAGSFVKEFAIEKNKPKLTPNNNEFWLVFGDALADITFSLSAFHSVTNSPVSGTYVFIEEPETEEVMGQQTITLATVVAAQELDITKIQGIVSEEKIYFRFTPTGNSILNHSLSWGDVKLNVEDKITDDSVNANDTTRSVTITKSIVTEIDDQVLNNMQGGSIVKETIKIAIRANFTDTSGKFFFIGLRLGEFLGDGEYSYKYLTAGGSEFDVSGLGLSYDYYFPEWTQNGKQAREKYSYASIQAVFVEDRSSMTKTYTGGNILFNLTFSPSDNSFYKFSHSSSEYYVAGSWVPTAPSSIGEYLIRYNIVNSDSNVGESPVVGTCERTITILPVQMDADRRTGVGSYSVETGWGTALSYLLSSKGTVSGAVTQYYFSNDYDEDNPSSSTWTAIDKVPASSTGCAVVYDFPAPIPEPGNVGGSYAREWTFMAIGPGGQGVTFGGVTYNLVSISQTKTYKVDSYIPSILSAEIGQYIDGVWQEYQGQPTNQPVYYRATISYGGSGAQVLILGAGKTSLLNSYLPDASFNGGSDAEIKSASIEFALETSPGMSKEYAGNTYVKVVNVFNKGSIYQTGDPLDDHPFPVHTDRTPPTIDFISSNFSANQNGWDNKQCSFYFSITDSGVSPSGVEISTYSCPGVALISPSLEGSIYNRVCEIQIRDNLEYTFSIVDKAGNMFYVIIQANIDVETISFELDEESYASGVWTNTLSTIIGNVKSGPSGVKYEYKVEGGEYQLWDIERQYINPVYSLEEDGYLSSNQFEIDPGENGVNEIFTLRISNLAGSYTESTFSVKLDVHLPTINVSTNLTPYQGSVFTTSAVRVNFSVADKAHTFNSEVKDVYMDDGGTRTLLSPISGLDYTYEVTKCTPHMILVYDNAGNEGVYSFTLKVDLGTPSITAALYVGGGNPQDPTQLPEEGENDSEHEYDFLDIYKYVTELDGNPWIRMEFLITATASGTILQRSINKTVWTDVSTALIPEGAETQQEFNIRLFFESEQNTPYHFRIVTGGNRFTYLTSAGPSDAGPPTSYQIRIDKTPPEFNQKFIVDRVEKDLTTEWTTQSATWKFSFFEDPVIGSGLKTDSIALYSFPYSMNDEDIISEYTGEASMQNGVKMTLPIPAVGEYTLTLSEDSRKFLLTAKDFAGHETICVVFPLIDRTQNFFVSGITPSVKKIDGTSSSSEYSNSFWVPTDERVDFLITTAFNENGNSYFGPSGGGVEFSVDGGITWQTFIKIEGIEQSINFLEDNIYSLVAKQSQYYKYKFRAWTGAGYYAPFEGEYWVKKDNVSPEISLSVTWTGNGFVDEPYDGNDWIDGTVKINMEILLGASFGRIYYATTPIGGGDISEWLLFKTIERSDVAYNSSTDSYSYDGSILINTTNYATYLVKIVTNRDPDGEEEYIYALSDPGVDIRLDRESIVIEGRGYKELSESVLYSGDWSDENIYLKAFPTSKGPSDVVEVYIAIFEDGDWTEYQLLGNNLDASYFISSEYYLTKEYRLKVKNATGKEGVSLVYKANIDKYTPVFDMSINTSPWALGTYTGWYVQNVEIEIEPTQHPEYGYDGYIPSYYYREHIVEQGIDEGWIGPVDAEAFLFFLDADNVVGGNNFDYRFTVRGRSGIEASYVVEYIPIDTTQYTYTLSLSVADVPDPMIGGEWVFASFVQGTSGTYTRGMNPEVGFICASAYRIKSIKEITSSGSTYLVPEQSFLDSSSTYNKVYEFGGTHIEWEVDLYRELSIEYSYQTQFLQQGSILSIGYSPTDSAFSEVFGGLTHVANPSETQVGLVIEYSLNGGEATSVIPQNLGLYSVEVSIRNSQSNIYITNPNTSFRVVYFSGEGTRNDPYLVGSQVDFEMISQYMYFEDGYELEDPLAFLGINRRTSYFKQSEDFVVSRYMPPICGRGVGYVSDFMGNYNGNGYVISILDTVNVDASYALFAYVSGGDGAAMIENLGVKMSQKINDTPTTRAIGFIVSELTNATVKNSYVIGSVTLTGESIFFGGVVGKANNSLIAQCYSDVNITITSSTGMVGGVVGSLYNNSFCDAVFSSGIVKVIESNMYIKTQPLGGALCVGSIAGHSTSLGNGIAPERDNYYIKNNLAVDGIVFSTLPMANIEDFVTLKMLGITGFEMFSSTKEVIAVEGREETLGSLVGKTMQSKADALMVSGLGILTSPYIINDSSKFAMVERIPWAYFEQTANISFQATQRKYYSYDMPFTGIYDGKNYEIRNIEIELDEGKYFGLFSVIKGSVKNVKLVGVDMQISSDSEDIFVGALCGLLLEEGIVDNVIVSGEIKTTSISGNIMLGGIIGLVNRATVTNCMSMASVNVLSGDYSVVGGLIAQVQDQSTISHLVGISTVTNNFYISGGTGRVIAIILSGSASISHLYAVEGICYSNGKLVLGECVAYSAASITDEHVANYNGIAGSASTIAIGGVFVKDIVTSLFPFAEGTGTNANPFKISTYKELLEIGNYMYASFVLTENIIIGDLNGDGLLTGADGYKYDFSPIGNGVAFTGSLDGTSEKIVGGTSLLVKHYIVGLNQPLFDINAGRVANIGLSVEYKLYAREEDIKESEKFEVNGKVYSPSSVVSPKTDVYFGSVARFNRSEGNLRNITVEGDITINVPGNQRVVVGGLVGADYGGSIIANIVEITMNIKGFVVEAGGVAGSVQGGDASLAYMDTQIVEGEIRVNAATPSVGVMVGAVKVISSKPMPTITPECDIYINNILSPSPPAYGRR